MLNFGGGGYTMDQPDRGPEPRAPGSEPRARHLFGLAAFSAALQSAGCLRVNCDIVTVQQFP